MPLFECENCHHVDNTALTNYWLRGSGPALCSLCDFGRWHGRFERRPASEYEPDRGNFLRRKSTNAPKGADDG